MGGTVNAAAAVVRNTQGDAEGAIADRPEGVPGVRPVSDEPGRAAEPSLRERREAATVDGDAAAHRSLHTRQAAVVGTSQGRGTADCLSRFLIPPDLEPTVHTNARGVTLFQGMRHGLLATDGLGLRLLESLPDDQLTSFCDKVDRFPETPDPSESATRVHSVVTTLRKADPIDKKGAVEFFRHAAADYMGIEVAAAALATDTARCERALNGEVLDLNLCAVSLLRPVESANSHRRQAHGLRCMYIGNPRSLRLRDPADGEKRAAKVNINVRQFALSSFGDGGNWVRFEHEPNHARESLEQLLGPIAEDRLTGDAGRRADAINVHALELNRTLHSRTLGQAPAVPVAGADSATAELSRAALAANRVAIANEFKSLARKFQILTEAGAQLKAMWAEQGDWPVGADGHLRAAALILLMAHNMGEVALLSGSDKGLTERLDAEVKCLATYADSHGGHLPPFDSPVQR